MYTHHDDQKNILEVVSETQCVGAEQGKVSLQELWMKHRDSVRLLMPKTARDTQQSTEGMGLKTAKKKQKTWGKHSESGEI